MNKKRTLAPPQSTAFKKTRRSYTRELKTLLVLDFDDTLFPTTVIMAMKKTQNIKRAGELMLPPSMWALFRKLDQLVTDLLHKVMLYSDLAVIVTNARLSWVRIATKLFLPTTNSFLFMSKSMEVISARDLFSTTSPKSVTWKLNALESVVKDFYSTEIKQDLEEDETSTIKNIISIGDGDLEAEIVHHICDTTDNCLRKIFSLTGSFSLSAMIEKLEQLDQDVESVADERIDRVVEVSA